MAEFEVFGTYEQANPDEKTYQAQYEYYKSGNSKIKLTQSSFSPAWWWLRSPCFPYNEWFACGGSQGTAGRYNSKSSEGVSPVFLV